MRLSITDLAKNIGEEKEFEISEKVLNMELSGEAVEFTGPVNIKGTMVYENGVVELRGKMNFELELRCHRCDTSFRKIFSIDIDEHFSNSEDVPEDFYRFTGNEIELDNMVNDIVLTGIPMKNLCSEECKGLCSICGKNLNFEECNCKVNDYDPRLEKLLKFKNDL